MTIYEVAVFKRDVGYSCGNLENGEYVSGSHGYDTIDGDFVEEVAKRRVPLRNQPDITAEVVNMVPRAYQRSLNSKPLSEAELGRVLDALRGE